MRFLGALVFGAMQAGILLILEGIATGIWLALWRYFMLSLAFSVLFVIWPVLEPLPFRNYLVIILASVAVVPLAVVPIIQENHRRQGGRRHGRGLDGTREVDRQEWFPSLTAQVQRFVVVGALVGFILLLLLLYSLNLISIRDVWRHVVLIGAFVLAAFLMWLKAR